MADCQIEPIIEGLKL